MAASRRWEHVFEGEEALGESFGGWGGKGGGGDGGVCRWVRVGQLGGGAGEG